MKRLMWTLSLLAVTGVATAIAQPPSGQGGRGPGGGPGGPGGDDRPPPNPIVEALDKNHDHVISADEMKNASAALRALDKNKDGKLTEDELRPHRDQGKAGGRPGQGDGGRGPQGRGPQQDGGPDGPPPRSPERFVEHAMEFDADNDGKLSKDELAKFADDVHSRQDNGPGSDAKEGQKPERPRRPD